MLTNQFGIAVVGQWSRFINLVLIDKVENKLQLGVVLVGLWPNSDRVVVPPGYSYESPSQSTPDVVEPFFYNA